MKRYFTLVLLESSTFPSQNDKLGKSMAATETFQRTGGSVYKQEQEVARLRQSVVASRSYLERHLHARTFW